MNTLTKILMVVAALLLGACSATTNFEAPDTKVDIGAETADELIVTLAGNAATLDLVFANPLPDAHVEQAEDVYDLIGNEATLQVMNSNGVGTTLTQHPVETAPAAPGDYTVQISEDNTTVTITFYNESLEGYTLNPGGDYSALLHVAENDFFETDDITYTVVVVE